MTLPEDQSGTIIYYDMESFDTKDESCIEAAKAFVSGWSDHLRRAGSQSGLYGSACLPRMDTYAGIANPPDAIWVASWIGATYDPIVYGLGHSMSLPIHCGTRVNGSVNTLVDMTKPGAKSRSILTATC